MAGEEYSFKVAIGPLTTSYGFRYWSLLFGVDRIVVYPYRQREVFWLLVNNYLKKYDADPGIAVREEAMDGVNVERFIRARDAKSIDSSMVRRIEVVSGYSKNKIKIYFHSGKIDVFSIVNRVQTESYRQSLRGLYPEKYIDQGHPSSWLGKILKR